jgi:predicted phage-related endonuclease
MAIRFRPITNRETWLNEWRPRNVNASEGGALFGIDRYMSPLQLYYIKKGFPGAEDNAAMRRGRWLEPAVLKATAETRPDLKIEPCSFYVEDTDLRVGCTPDAFIWDKDGRQGILQCKTAGQNVFEEWRENAGGPIPVPPSYELQTLIEATLTQRADFALLAVLVVGYKVDLHIWEVPIRREPWQAFLFKVKTFWDNFAAGIEPPATEPDGDFLKRLYPTHIPGKVIDLTGNNVLPELIELHEELSAKMSEGKAAIKPFEDEREGIRTIIKGLIGDAEIALLPYGKKATLKLVHRKASAARTLRISDIKE